MIDYEAVYKLAKAGHCDRCGQTIKIYTYGLNKTLVRFLRAMEAEVQRNADNDVDISGIGLKYSERSQVTKLRLHGLIARVKNPDGTQKANRWLITKKGWNFLRGVPIDSKVVSFNNHVIGHEGKPTTIHAVTGESPDEKYTEQSITEPESELYSQVKDNPVRGQSHLALYVGRHSPELVGGQYELEIGQMQIGKPVQVKLPDGQTFSYPDIAAFQRNWQILKKEQEA